MNENIVEHYYSIPYQYAGNSEPDLELKINYRSKNSLEIELINKRYNNLTKAKLKQIAFTLCLYSISQTIEINRKSIYVNLFFILYLLYLTKGLIDVIKSG